MPLVPLVPLDLEEIIKQSLKTTVAGWWLSSPPRPAKYDFVNWDDNRNPIWMGKCQIHGNQSPPTSYKLTQLVFHCMWLYLLAHFLGNLWIHDHFFAARWCTCWVSRSPPKADLAASDPQLNKHIWIRLTNLGDTISHGKSPTHGCSYGKNHV